MSKYGFYQFMKYFLLLSIALYCTGMIIFDAICYATYDPTKIDLSKTSLLMGLILFSILFVVDIIVFIMVFRKDKYRNLFTKQNN